MQSAIIADTCREHMKQLMIKVQSLCPADYGLVSSRKKIRDTKGGEMQKFKERIREQEEHEPADLLIEPSELRELDIEVP